MNQTDVIFRLIAPGNVIALFPGIAGTDDPHTCMSYHPVSQHEPISIGYATAWALASPVQYADLRRELERRGYVLRVVKRATVRHYRERAAQVARS